MDFYGAGWSGYGSEMPDAVKAPRAEAAATWYYSDSAFNEFRARVQANLRWFYTGGTDLVLLNSRYAPTRRHEPLDFRRAVVMDLEKMKSDGAISSVSSLFEDICRYSEAPADVDPVGGFSDAMAIRCGKAGLKSA